MKNLQFVLMFAIVLLVSCNKNETRTVTEGDVAITTVDIGDRNIKIVESLSKRHGLIWLGCGEPLTEGFCDKCRRGQINDLSNNKPMRDCSRACKTKNCKAPEHEGVKMFVMQE